MRLLCDGCGGNGHLSEVRALGFTEPHVEGANADGKLRIDVGWQRDSTFADVIGALIAYIDGTCGEFGPNRTPRL